MANAREIQSRMKSIKDTMKITNAMYMISSSKLSKARTDLKNKLHLFALGVLGGDLQAQNGSHIPKIIRVLLVELLHGLIAHVADAEVICGRGQIFHLHRQIDALRVAVLVLVGSSGLGMCISAAAHSRTESLAGLRCAAAFVCWLSGT